VLQKNIIRDAAGACLLLTGCLIAGLLLNEMRPGALPWIYSPLGARLHQVTEELSPSTINSLALDEGIDRDEMQKISIDHGALVIDARPEKQYRSGHIPSAVSLPRDDFDQRYQVLQPVLQSHLDQRIIVYCSNFHCPDSQIVAAELLKRGCQHVRLFRGGWDDWQTAGLPEEKE